MQRAAFRDLWVFHGPPVVLCVAAMGAGAMPLSPTASALPEAPWLPALTVWAAALVFWPGLEAPFTTPKTAVLGLGALGLAVQALARGAVGRRRVPWVALALALALGLSAVWGDATQVGALALHVAALALLVAGCVAGVDAARLARALGAAGAVVAAVVLLQAVGVDPFARLDPQLTGSRLRLYGTLGNPDFAAALIGAALWPTAWACREASPRGRVGWSLALVAQAGALAATQSFATLLALGGGAALVALRGRVTTERRGLALAAVLLLALGGLITFSASGRAPGRLAEGRLYLWRVSAPAVLDAPLFGHGPGSVEALWPAWQVARPGLTLAAPDFAAPQNHAHADALERALEQGFVGLAALVALLVVVLRRGLRAPAPAFALACAVASLVARGLVDFPLSRPAELGVFALSCAAVLTSPSRKETS